MRADLENDIQDSHGLAHSPSPSANRSTSVALLTGGGDRPYVYGLVTSLLSHGAAVDLIGSDDLKCPEFLAHSGVKFLNLRGDQRSDVPFLRKVLRVTLYYVKLIRYAATSSAKIFHILWNNKFELFDRTLLMLYYRLLGKRIVFTVHNVNASVRDRKDTRLNRLTLRAQYRLTDHIFVHTEKMKREMTEQFGVPAALITVVPFGINNAVPNTSITAAEARQRLGLQRNDKVILSFGNITPYKGLEYLATAFRRLLSEHQDYRLIIAGKVDKCESYWSEIREQLREEVRSGRALVRPEFVPDEETEVYFKAADVLVLPYRHVYQSGVLFLGHSFGLPVLAADVGSLQDDIVEGKTGFTFRPEDPAELANVIERYFSSDLYANLNSRRQEIKDYAAARHSWDLVAQPTMSVYSGLLRNPAARKLI